MFSSILKCLLYWSLVNVNKNAGKWVYCGFPHVPAVVYDAKLMFFGPLCCTLWSAHQIRSPAAVCAASYVYTNAAGHYSGCFCGHAHSPQAQSDASLGPQMEHISGILVFASPTGWWKEDRKKTWLTVTVNIFLLHLIEVLKNASCFQLSGFKYCMKRKIFVSCVRIIFVLNLPLSPLWPPDNFWNPLNYPGCCVVELFPVHQTEALPVLKRKVNGQKDIILALCMHIMIQITSLMNYRLLHSMLLSMRAKEYN